MLRKTERLSRNDFSLITNATRKMVRGTLFDVMYVTSEYSKVACVVAKKTLPRAVDRNRIKRRIYSLYKKLRPTKACIMVIYPKKQALRISHKVLQDEMKGIFATL